MSKTYTPEFKRQMVELKKSGRSSAELYREYDVTKQSLNTWYREHENSGSFGVKNNLSESEKELRELRKQNKQLLMEVDILKQAALIMSRK